MELSFVAKKKCVRLSDEEIYQYCLNLKEHVPSRRSTRLPSRSKHGQKFGGTEITLCTYESINNLVVGFTCFLQKVKHASHVFGSASRVVEGNRWMLCLEISYEHIMLCIHALLAITLPHANLKNSFIKYVSDPDQRLVADCNLVDLDTAVIADRRGHFAILLSKNHFEVCLVILYELLVQDRFPNPKALVNELHLNGFKAIWMLDPGIKHEEGYFVYDSGSKEDVWIQNVDGKPFVGKFKFPLIFPSTLEVSNLISASEEQYYKIRLGTQWLHRRVEVDGYEEYSEVEYSPAWCIGEYTVIERNLEQEGRDESLKLERDIGGGLVLQRQISVPKNYPKLLHIDSGIIARNVGSGSDGFSREGSETEYNNSLSDPLLIRDGSETEYNNSVSDPSLISNGSETECNYNCTISKSFHLCSVFVPFLNSVSSPSLISNGNTFPLLIESATTILETE
ncbi:hypothetical protein Syun_020804 [Stephania yunnanensis]|uniref:Glycoside hydrolase family 31 TIM barrel domain-containing protein n=1 Tax=Stephania yunnanensis TaxID=152371 RepID=A0AAP0NNK3_9MAGN